MFSSPFLLRLNFRTAGKREHDTERNKDEWMVMPSPDVRYQMNLQYLVRSVNLLPNNIIVNFHKSDAVLQFLLFTKGLIG